jgi:hypothetical protein
VKSEADDSITWNTRRMIRDIGSIPLRAGRRAICNWRQGDMYKKLPPLLDSMSYDEQKPRTIQVDVSADVAVEVWSRGLCMLRG